MAKHTKKYAMLINLERCAGCFACQITCKAEYNIPFGTFRCKVETYRSGSYPEIGKFFLPRLCNHCGTAPCIEACEEKALFKNQDGVVLLNSNKCIGCGMCFEKCPYDAIDLNPATGQAEKCDFCYEGQVMKGRPPVCVQSCMGKAILFGDTNDKNSDISVALGNHNIKALKPELATKPSVFYVFRGDTGNAPLKDHKITIRHSITQKVREEPENRTNLVYTSDAMCPSECGISVLVEDGVAKKIYGNPHTLINNGTLCAKGASGLQLTYSPHRIKTPLIRTGRRGEEKWKEISWDEAIDYIAKKLIEIKEKYGPESVFLDCGDVTDREAYYRLFHAFGTPNTFNHGSICDPNRRWGQGIMMGDERPLPDIQRPVLMRNSEGALHLKKNHDIKLLLNIGANPLVATRFNYMSNGIPSAREENGCTYIVIDPAYTNSASHADIWLPIIPGTDAALLAAMLHYIIGNDSPVNSSKKYIDHAFLKKYTMGWQEFKESFLAQADKKDPSNGLQFFSIEWAENKTGITANEIKKISHLFGITKPAAIEIGMHGTSHHTNGDVTSILMTALCLITGNADIPGGLVFIDSQKAKKGNRTVGKEFLDKVVTRKINGSPVSGKLSELHKDLYGDYPAAWKGVLADLPVKIRKGINLKYGSFQDYSYPIKAFITRAGNPVMTAGNTAEWKDALTSRDETGEYLLELMVFIDTHITESGKYADIVLPEAGFLERMGVSDVYTMSPEISIRDQVIKPLYESRTPFQFMITMSDSLIKNGDPDIKAEDFKIKYKSEEAFINEILSEAPGFYNIGAPLPYPDLPEGSLIAGVPDNPGAVWGNKTIKTGELLTVDWLRKHNGVAVWPASYHRYKKSDGSPSGIYPKTASKKFEFKFSFLENINKTFGTDFPTTFYWSECKWNPGNPLYKNINTEYPFQLISGRVHHAMTMTAVCPYLAETDTECMQPVNNDFHYKMPELENIPNKYGLQDNKDNFFKQGSLSIPVFAFNTKDGKRLDLKTGNIVSLENPFKKRITGKVFLTDEIMPGVIKTAFGPGGRKASGTGFMNHTFNYTPNINELHDPENISPFTGMPAFGDIMVKVIKERN
ncbi:MAG TPA: dehydrogenase [Nitrospirae bacterium]|nr:tetrathionate reductase subunit B precursor [bacterium BMS3Abin06]HDH11820.1 dehydrogenase [Nitrospirota bacterium]HDZ02838.1 dehydrogenase [Nitrospirota bacterium]